MFWIILICSNNGLGWWSGGISGFTGGYFNSSDEMFEYYKAYGQQEISSDAEIL